jgi:flagellar FliL protein
MSNKLIFLIVAVLLVLTVGLAGGLFMMWSKLSSIEAQGNPTATSGAEQSQASSLGPLFSLETFIVNLADQERSLYLRVTMDLELVESTFAAELEKRLSQVRDSILMILPSKRFADIASMEGKTALRDEIITKLNGLFAENVVSNLFFTEFVVQ